MKVSTNGCAKDYLSMDGTCYSWSSNGITKLYAQLLAAKLNIKTGTNCDAVKDVISAADSFLAQNNESDWWHLASWQKNRILSWASTLDDYNNGK